MAEPLLPMTDDVGVEFEFGAAPDLPWIALDANPASLARCHQRAVLVHAGSLEPGIDFAPCYSRPTPMARVAAAFTTDFNASNIALMMT